MKSSIRNLKYEPGLDGLRAVAVLSVFALHSNLGWAPGGFLGVSTFFTLSGFLIMALLVRERETTGRIDLTRFWLQRARRLLPAALLAVLGITVATFFLGDAKQVGSISWDVVSSLFYFANWRFAFQEITYAGAFGGQSPFLHFWSLAIEEQFYLFFPLVILATMRIGSNWRKSVGVTLTLGILLSWFLGLTASLGEAAIDRLYFRTDIRAAELLVGALFGLWWMGSAGKLSPAFRSRIRWLGVVLLVAMGALIATADYRDKFWYQGGLVVYSLLTVGVILACVEGQGFVRRILSWPPLVHVGVVSYGAYLVHWPVYMWLYTETHIPGALRLVGGALASIAIATISYRWLERPIREGKLGSARPLTYSGVTAAGFAILLGLGVANFGDRPVAELEEAAARFEREQEEGPAVPEHLPKIGIFGDSTAVVVAYGLVLASESGTQLAVNSSGGWASLGCTPSAPGRFVVKGVTWPSNPACAGWIEEWRAASVDGELDAAVVMFGPWEVRAVQPEGWDKFHVLGEDRRRDDFVRQRIRDGLDALSSTPLIIIFTSPYIESGRVEGRSPARPNPESDPKLMDRLNEIILDVASQYENVAIVDLASWVETSQDEKRLRPDGMHFSKQSAQDLAPLFADTFAAIVEVYSGASVDEERPATLPILRYIQP